MRLIEAKNGAESQPLLGNRETSASPRQFEELVPALLSSSQSVFYIAQDGKFQVVTEQLLKQMNLTREGLLGAEALSIVHPDDRAEVRENAIKMLKGERSEPYEFRALDKAGNIHYVREAVTSITYRGKRATLGNWIDLTERKRAEEALRFSDAAFRSLHEGIVAMDNEDNITYWNSISEQLFGYKASEVIGKKIFNVVNPIEIISGQHKNGRPKELSERGYHRDELTFDTPQGKLWMDVTIREIKQNSKIEGFILTYQDITARKEAEAALRESEEKYRNVVERAGDGICIIQDKIIKFANLQQAKMWGGSAGEIIDTPFVNYIHPDALPEVLDRYRRRMSGEPVPSNYESVLLRQDGSKAYVELNVGMIMYLGKPAELVFVRDITERKKMEAELRTSEERLKRIFTSINDAITVLDLDGTIVECNETTVKLFGFDSMDELLGKSSFEIVVPGEHENVRAVMQKTLEKGAVRNIQFTLRKADGSEFFGEINGSVLKDVNGLSIGFIVITRDITRRKRLEEEIKAHQEHLEGLVMERTTQLEAVNAQLERELGERKRIEDELRVALRNAGAANRAKSDFLARMSHEIRTPIHGVMGILGLLSGTELKREQSQYVTMARNSSEALLGVINGILDFSRIEAGKVELETREFNLRELLEQSLETVAVPAHNKELEIMLRISRNMPATLVGDAGRLHQVLVNLLGNAVKFTERGEIVLRADVEAESERVWELLFSVSDTGIGIPAEKHELLFHPFEQVDGSMNRKYGGSGLGLSICLQLVNMMGGRIWLTSQPGEGSVFHFTAKFGKSAGEEKTESGSAVAEIPYCLRGIPLLLVDDNATYRAILRDSLTAWGFQVTEADSAHSALKELEDRKGASRNFGIILMDKTLPDINGYCGQILCDPVLRQSIITMVTSNHISDSVARCQEHGLSHYLVKPIKESEMLNTILSVLGYAKEVKAANKQDVPVPEANVSTPIRILVVEDNPTSQLVARRTLEKAGHTVRIASNGMDAARMASEGDFNLILMDVEMPEMNGLDAARAIRAMEQKSGRHTPIIAMTAYAMKEDRQRCLQAGMDAYLSKPIDLAKLHGLIKNISKKEDAPSEIMDVEAALKLAGGDASILSAQVEKITGTSVS